METLDFGGLVRDGIRVPVGPAGELLHIYQVPRFSWEGSGPGGVRSGWDQVARRERGGSVRAFICSARCAVRARRNEGERRRVSTRQSGGVGYELNSERKL